MEGQEVYRQFCGVFVALSTPLFMQNDTRIIPVYMAKIMASYFLKNITEEENNLLDEWIALVQGFPLLIRVH